MEMGMQYLGQRTNTALTFVTHYHPYVDEFIKALQRTGIRGLLTLDMQRPYVPPRGFDDSFYKKYGPDLNRVDESRTWECVDFGYQLGTGSTPNYSDQPREGYGTYALYNWELFFHAPLLLATRLSQTQQFAEAQTWFHYICVATSSVQDPAPPPQLYLQYLPLQI